MIAQNYNLAFVFPGQGSQTVGMLAELAEQFPEIKQTFKEASDVLNQDLWSIVQDDPDNSLNQTHITQPVMLAAGVAIWRTWSSQTAIRPGWMAGHSLGEYTALVCSEALAFDSAIALVAERGRLMQEAVPAGTGAMAAILGLEDQEVVRVCAEVEAGEVVSAVNFNAPGQVVIAGNTAAVERAMEAAKDAGAKRAVKLPVSVPSHCALMTSAAEKLALNLQKIDFEIPKMTIIHNVDIASHSAPEVIRSVLKDQLYKPVRWVDSIKFMYEQGVVSFIECGPGKVLQGLNKRIAKQANHLNINEPNTLNKVLEQLT